MLNKTSCQLTKVERAMPVTWATGMQEVHFTYMQLVDLVQYRTGGTDTLAHAT